MNISLYFYRMDFRIERIKRKGLKEIIAEYKMRLRKFIAKQFPVSEQLFRYGTGSLSNYDWRTSQERRNDNIRIFLLSLLEDKDVEYTTRKRARRIGNMNFSSWFDIGVGKKVSSRDDIKKLEAEGQIFLTDDEMDRETARFRKYKKDEQRQISDKIWENIFERQKQGEFKRPRYVERVDPSRASRGEYQ